MENQELLKYLQQVLKKHDMESSIDELAAICERYGIESIEQVETDTIVGIYNTLKANRQKNDSIGGNLATIMKQKFQQKAEKEAQTIVQEYQNIPIEIQEAVIKKMLLEYTKKNPKIDDFLREADYAKIAEENIQSSQQMLKYVLLGLLSILLILSFSSLVESFGSLINSKPNKEVVYVNK
jgi:hypothetical protein